MDGKFLGVLDVPKSYVGDAHSIFEAIKIQRPKDIKKIDLLLSKGDAS